MEPILYIPVTIFSIRVDGTDSIKVNLHSVSHVLIYENFISVWESKSVAMVVPSRDQRPSIALLFEAIRRDLVGVSPFHG
jgi:hypothetical protein